MTPSHFWQRLAQAVAALRDVWVALGVALILFLTLEASYRGLTALRAAPPAAPAADSSLHPYARKPWRAELQRNLLARNNHFDPYRGAWPNSVTTRYVNVSAAGRRWTPQPVPDAPGVMRVVMLGGSVMWGFTARDSFAIPALVAARLAADGVGNVRVESLTTTSRARLESVQEAMREALTQIDKKISS